MENPVGNLDRRSLLKMVGVAGAATAVGVTAATPSVAAVAKTNTPGTGAVNYWNHFTGADERAGFKAVTDGFAKASPKINLAVETILNDDWMIKYVAAVAAKSGPDALMITAVRMGDMIKLGGVADITTYAKQWPGLEKGTEAQKAFTVKGKIYGVPVFTFVDWVYYRKDLLEAKGIKAPPKTLEEFRQTAIALSDPSKGIYGFGMRGGSGGGGFVPKMIHAFNGPLINHRTLNRTVDFGALRDAVAFWVNLHLKDKCVPPTVTGDGFAQLFQAFYSGKTAMVMHHTGTFVTVGNNFKYGTQVETAKMPDGPKATTGVFSPLGNTVFKGAKNPDGGFEFASYWGSAPAQAAFLKATGYIPTATAAVNDPFVTANPQFKVAFNALETGYYNDYIFPGYSTWASNTCLPEIQKALTGAQKSEVSAKKIFDELGRICKLNARNRYSN